MKIDDNLLSKLQNLAMIELDEDKKESMKNELQEIMDFVDNLNRLETKDLEATFSTLESKTPLREDVPLCDTSIGQSVLNHAPKAHDGYFIVPKIL